MTVIELLACVFPMFLFVVLVICGMIIDYKMEKYGLYDRIELRKYRRKLRREQERMRKKKRVKNGYCPIEER